MRESCKSYEGATRVLKGSWHSDITNRANRTNKIGTSAEQNRFSDRLKRQTKRQNRTSEKSSLKASK